MTTESIRVEITASSDTTHVDHYLTTTIEDPSKVCQGQQCVLSELKHARKYTVVSRACLAVAEACSDAVEAATWTKPTCMRLFVQCRN